MRISKSGEIIDRNLKTITINILKWLYNFFVKTMLAPAFLFFYMYKDERSDWSHDCFLRRLLKENELTWNEWYKENHTSIWQDFSWYFRWKIFELK